MTRLNKQAIAARFIVIKIVKKDENSRQYLMRRMNLSPENETSFDNYVDAQVYAENFENSYIILDEDFQLYMCSLDIIARATKAREVSLCTG